MFVCLSVCLFVCLFVWLACWLADWLAGWLSFCPTVRLSICLYILLLNAVSCSRLLGLQAAENVWRQYVATLPTVHDNIDTWRQMQCIIFQTLLQPTLALRKSLNSSALLDACGTVTPSGDSDEVPRLVAVEETSSVKTVYLGVYITHSNVLVAYCYATYCDAFSDLNCTGHEFFIGRIC